MPRAVARFKEQNPDIEISIKTGRSYEVEQWLIDNELELGVIEGDPSSSILLKVPWYEDDLVLVLSPKSPLLKRRRLLLQDILNEPFLLQAPGIRPTFIERVLAKKGIAIRKPVTVGSREAVKAAVAAGCGVAILPQSVIDTELHARLLKVRVIPDLNVKYPVNIVYRRDRQLSRWALVFLDILKKQSVDPSLRPPTHRDHKKKRLSRLL